MAAKFGYEAIKYILTKVLTKKGVKGIPTIPGKAYEMRMGQLVDEMAKKMRALGYDINKVTEKQVQGLLDSAAAMEKQKVKKASQGITGLKKKSTSTKERPFSGWTPHVIEGGGTSPDDFLKLKEDTYRRLMLNTDDAVKAFGKRIINKTQDVKFEKLSKDQRKGIMSLIEDRIRLGNREFMNKHNDLDVGFDPDDFACGASRVWGWE